MTTIKASGRDLELKSDQDIVFYPTSNIWISQGTKLIFEGTVPDDFEVKLQATSVTADRDIILPDASGTMATQEWASSQFTSQPVATISGATQANPVVITTAAAHNFTNGASVTITDVVGMTELNSNSYYVSVLTSTTAALYSDAGLTASVDGTAFTAYVSDGVATQSLTASLDFSSLLNKPTTIAGYGITDGYTNSNVDAHLNQSTATSNQVLSWDGADYAWVAQTTGYGDTNVNTHLNQSTATTNQVLSWNGSDYDWIDQSSFQNVVDDTTPELGGDLNMNGNDIIGTGNINITGSVTSTAVGVPTITSSTDINFTAGTGATDRVAVTQSPFKLASFTTVGRDAKTGENGDLIYNSDNNTVDAYINGSWTTFLSDPLGAIVVPSVNGTAADGNLQLGNNSDAVSINGNTVTSQSTSTTTVSSSAGSVNLFSVGATDARLLLNGTGGQILLQSNTQIDIGAGTGAVDGDINIFYGNVDIQRGNLTVAGLTTLAETTEVTSDLTGATGVVVHNLDNGAVFDHTSLAADFTANFTNVPTTANRTISVVLILSQGATAYMPTAVQIDGAAQTILWQGGSAPAGTASGTDVVGFTLIRSSGGAWKVVGSATGYA